MRLCLVEDPGAAGLEPLTLTRPVYELRYGANTIGRVIAHAFGIEPETSDRGAMIRPSLEAVTRERDPELAVNDPNWLAQNVTVVVNSRWIPPADFDGTQIGPPWIGLAQGRPAFAVVDPERAGALVDVAVDDWFDDLAAKVGGAEVGGHWIDRPWDLVDQIEDGVIREFERLGSAVSNRQLHAMALIGSPDRLQIHETARIDPCTVFDTTHGPIIVGPGAWVQPFTRLEGPCSIGAETQLFRANLRGGVAIGPQCRIGGEVEASIVHGFSNKYHDGFLGHAYVGEWVNLGAITSNSDLRNDYGEVSVPLQGDPIATGKPKVGAFIGDHTRTGLGSFLNTGTSIGVMCNVLPAGWLLPKHVPSFSAVLWGRVAPGFGMEQLFETAAIVKGRRGQEFTEAEQQLYRNLFERTRIERERAFKRTAERPIIEEPRAAASG